MVQVNQQSLRIIAGIDKEYDGDVNLSKGVSVGYLEQEPQIKPRKNS
jgi:sulfate-transporting ATPase